MAFAVVLGFSASRRRPARRTLDAPEAEALTKRPITTALLTVGVGWSLLGGLDPSLPGGRTIGPGLALLAWAARRMSGQVIGHASLAALLAVSLAVGALAGPRFFRADFTSYFAYLRSLAFDRDLDFANEWERWRLPERPLTPTGHRLTFGSIGPAVLWSPFFCLAHLYVLADGAAGLQRFSVDGYSAPYIRSAFVGTLTAAVVASWLLIGVLARYLPRPIAVIAVVAAVGTSPILVYLSLQPGMAHGLTYSLAALLLWAAERAQRCPSRGAWVAIGGILGLLALVRLQAAVLCVFLVPVVLSDLRRRTLRASWLLAAALTAFAAFLPQLLAWKAIFGSWWTVSSELDEWARQARLPIAVLFRPSQWFDASSPHWLDVLFSADRGFFAWTPGMLLGVVGLLFAVRRFGSLASGGVLAFLGAVWFNGSLVGWSGSDAFGARRFDLIVPFAAIGYGVILTACQRLPLLAPTLVLGGLVLWNVGLARLWIRSAFYHAAPLERVAMLQARQVHQATEAGLAAVAGAPGRAFAYNLFVGEFLFWNLKSGGEIDLSAADPPFLAGGWSESLNTAGRPRFRAALMPRSCVTFALLKPIELWASISARRPPELAEQSLSIVFNGRAVTRRSLDADWSQTEVTLPAAYAAAGPNTLCLEFQRAARLQSTSVAAHVREIQLRAAKPAGAR